MSVLVIDPHSLIRECVAHMLQRVGRQFRVVTLAAAAQVGQAENESVRLVLLSVNAARSTDPAVVGSLAILRERLPGVPIVLLSEREEPGLALEAIRLGASAYLPTSLSADVAIAALRLVLAGGVYIPPAAPEESVVPIAAEPVPHATTGTVDEVTLALGLTPREAEVLLCVQQGRANKMIAYALGISEHTVKVHLRRIMRKLKATNRTEVAAIAYERMGRVWQVQPVAQRPAPSSAPRRLRIAAAEERGGELRRAIERPAVMADARHLDHPPIEDALLLRR
jgi:DNA-binding NarL/FixJ family response regulator